MIYDMWTKLEVLLTFVTKAQFHFIRMTIVIFADKTGYPFNFFFSLLHINTVFIFD